MPAEEQSRNNSVVVGQGPGFSSRNTHDNILGSSAETMTPIQVEDGNFRLSQDSWSTALLPHHQPIRRKSHPCSLCPEFYLLKTSLGKPSGSSGFFWVWATLFPCLALPSIFLWSTQAFRYVWFHCASGTWTCIRFSSVAQSCLTLCDPMDCSTPFFPVHHQFPELVQTHAHQVGDAIQPSHPLSSPSPPALNLSQHQGLFQGVSSSHQVAKVLEFQLQHLSFQWIFKTDFL